MYLCWAYIKTYAKNSNRNSFIQMIPLFKSFS